MASSYNASMGVLQSIRYSSSRSVRAVYAQSLHEPASARTYTTWRKSSTAVSRGEGKIQASTTENRRVNTVARHSSREAFNLFTPRRSFHTSHVSSAAHDLSTIDFAYLPDLRGSDFMPGPAVIRVPILPTILSDDAEARLEKFPDLEAAAGGYQATEGGTVAIMKPQIETAAGAEMSHMSDIGDGHSEEMSIETLTKLTDVLGSKGKDLAEAFKSQDKGTIRVLWNSLLDDIFGAQKQKQ